MTPTPVVHFDFVRVVLRDLRDQVRRQQPANQAARNSKMSCTVTPPTWLKSAMQQLAASRRASPLLLVSLLRAPGIHIEPGNAGDDLREHWHTMRLAAGVRDAHVVVAHTSDAAPNPCVQEDRYMIHLCTQRAAVRRLTIDSWVHQSMVISGIPEPACVYIQAGVPLTLEAMRARHFPIPISLSVGKDDIPRLSDKSRQLHQNATRQILAATERPASEFKLVRATCVYPMLGLSYYLPAQYAERAT